MKSRMNAMYLRGAYTPVLSACGRSSRRLLIRQPSRLFHAKDDLASAMVARAPIERCPCLSQGKNPVDDGSKPAAELTGAERSLSRRLRHRNPGTERRSYVFTPQRLRAMNSIGRLTRVVEPPASHQGSTPSPPPSLTFVAHTQEGTSVRSDQPRASVHRRRQIVVRAAHA
jgi:hypothetical protein